MRLRSSESSRGYHDVLIGLSKALGEGGRERSGEENMGNFDVSSLLNVIGGHVQGEGAKGELGGMKTRQMSRGNVQQTVLFCSPLGLSYKMGGSFLSLRDKALNALAFTPTKPAQGV